MDQQNLIPFNSHRAHIRLSETEYKQAENLSRTLGRSIPQLFKSALFEGPIPSPLLSNDDAKSLMGQLQRIGNNVNQIAKHLNSGIREGFHKELNDVNEQIKVLRQYISGVYGHR